MSLNYHKPHADLIAFCMKHKRIHIYGAGVVAHRIAFVLNEEKLNVCDAIVTKKKAASYIKCNSFKLPIVEIGDADIGLGDGIVIATAEAEFISEIRHSLGQIGILDENILVQDMYDIDDLRYLEWNNMHSSTSEGYFSTYRELNEIGKTTNTDKVEFGHNFLNKYEFFLRPFKNRHITLMELGIYKGGSVNMWRRYFRDAKIYGVDIDENSVQYVDDDINTIIADLSKSESFESLGELMPDIIIDDASHIWSHQINALIRLFPSLPHGGDCPKTRVNMTIA